MLERRRAGRGAQEVMLSCHLGCKPNDEKTKIIKIRRGLKWPPISKITHNNQPKTAAAMEGTMEGRRDEREAWGKWGTIVLMAL